MTFEIPPNYHGHLDRTQRAIEALIQRKVITTFSMTSLKNWLKNFKDDRDLYLASHLLDSLIIRSDEMLQSMCRNAIQQTVMGLMRELGLWKEGEYREMLRRIQDGDPTLPLRFVIFDNFGDSVAKSGTEVVRICTRCEAIGKKLLIDAKDLNIQAEHINLFIILDNFAGTGTQFITFYNTSNFNEISHKSSIAFIPLIAHKSSIKAIQQSLTNVHYRPVEILAEKHDFFYESPTEPGKWARDKYNDVKDVREYYMQLLKRKNVPAQEERFNLNLTVGFEISTPNNTLNILWAQTEEWSNLLKRP